MSLTVASCSPWQWVTETERLLHGWIGLIVSTLQQADPSSPLSVYCWEEARRMSHWSHYHILGSTLRHRRSVHLCSSWKVTKTWGPCNYARISRNKQTDRGTCRHTNVNTEACKDYISIKMHRKRQCFSVCRNRKSTWEPVFSHCLGDSFSLSESHLD